MLSRFPWFPPANIMESCNDVDVDENKSDPYEAPTELSSIQLVVV